MKKGIIFSILSFAGVFFASSAKAFCPVCTIAIGAGVGFSRWVGIDDAISGVWIGGLTISMVFWTLDWINKRKFKIAFKNYIIPLVFYVLVIAPLYSWNIMGHPLNKMWGIDKILFGIILGSVVFLLSALTHTLLKKKNNSKSYFPYQKVAFPVSFLLITSLILHFIIQCPR